ncbi:hypothetical protein JHK85_010269 [Glycine max]|nr:hypothetical protein JHK85_010269 [Glycine max]
MSSWRPCPCMRKSGLADEVKLYGFCPSAFGSTATEAPSNAESGRSSANDVVFCGRILMFLAHFFPLSERSGIIV